MSNYCPHCGQRIRETHKEVLSKDKLLKLKAAASQVIATNKNEFSTIELSGNTSGYTNYQKLRYHGLIHHFKINGIKQRGKWLITRNGWAFLRGEIDLPKFVLVRDNRVVDRSPALVNVREVYRGSEAIVTTFEYFDDYGNPIGYRPVTYNPKERQAALL